MKLFLNKIINSLLIKFKRIARWILLSVCAGLFPFVFQISNNYILDKAIIWDKTFLYKSDLFLISGLILFFTWLQRLMDKTPLNDNCSTKPSKYATLEGFIVFIVIAMYTISINCFIQLRNIEKFDDFYYGLNIHFFNICLIFCIFLLLFNYPECKCNECETNGGENDV